LTQSEGVEAGLRSRFRRPRWPGFRAILRAILLAPFRLLRFILFLPFYLLRFLVRLPRRIWRAWKAAALALYRARIKTVTTIRQGLYYLREGRRLRRLYLPAEQVRRGLLGRLRPDRAGHILHVWLTRLRGRGIWQSPTGLDTVAKALTWAHRYQRHKGRFRDVEAVRSILYANQDLVQGIDAPLPIGVHARRTCITPHQGALLHGLVYFSSAQRVLELGTGLGLSGLYVARALLDNFPVRTCLFITIEHNRQFATIADDNFHQLGLNDFVHVEDGAIEAELPAALDQLSPVQLAYLEGDHDGDKTLRYVSQIKARMRPGGLIVLGDIRWSPGMARAWQTIQQMPRVAATVDLWAWGIVVVGEGPARRLSGAL
jgi:predicted O-methyltransferase YrrM